MKISLKVSVLATALTAGQQLCPMSNFITNLYNRISLTPSQQTSSCESCDVCKQRINTSAPFVLVSERNCSCHRVRLYHHSCFTPLNNQCPHCENYYDGYPAIINEAALYEEPVESPTHTPSSQALRYLPTSRHQHPQNSTAATNFNIPHHNHANLIRNYQRNSISSNLSQIVTATATMISNLLNPQSNNPQSNNPQSNNPQSDNPEEENIICADCNNAIKWDEPFYTCDEEFCRCSARNHYHKNCLEKHWAHTQPSSLYKCPQCQYAAKHRPTLMNQKTSPSEAAASLVPPLKDNDGNISQCIFCLEDIIDKDGIISDPHCQITRAQKDCQCSMNRIYHTKCFKSAFKASSTCPHCRRFFNGTVQVDIDLKTTTPCQASSSISPHISQTTNIAASPLLSPQQLKEPRQSQSMARRQNKRKLHLSYGRSSNKINPVLESLTNKNKIINEKLNALHHAMNNQLLDFKTTYSEIKIIINEFNQLRHEAHACIQNNGDEKTQHLLNNLIEQTQKNGALVMHTFDTLRKSFEQQFAQNNEMLNHRLEEIHHALELKRYDSTVILQILQEIERQFDNHKNHARQLLESNYYDDATQNSLQNSIKQIQARGFHIAQKLQLI